jgi:hypothetical protein
MIAGKEANLHLPVVVSFTHPFPAGAHDTWLQELKDRVQINTGNVQTVQPRREFTEPSQVKFYEIPRVVSETRHTPKVETPRQEPQSLTFPGGMWTIHKGRQVPGFFGKQLQRPACAPNHRVLAYIRRQGFKLIGFDVNGNSAWEADTDKWTVKGKNVFTWGGVLESMVNHDLAVMFNTETKKTRDNVPTASAALLAIYDEMVKEFAKDRKEFDTVKYTNGEEVFCYCSLTLNDKKYPMTQQEMDIYDHILESEIVSKQALEFHIREIHSGSVAHEDKFWLNKEADTTWYNTMVECGIAPELASVYARVQDISALKLAMPKDKFELFFKSYQETPA